jgi:Tol biopolymer transport system component
MATSRPSYRVLAPGQRCQVWVSDLAGRTRLVYETGDMLFEAPNWGPDGQLVLNAEGLLWELPATGGEPQPLPTEGLPPVNNDHVLSPDGSTIYASAEDRQIYAVPRSGGKAAQVSLDDGRLHFLHGISPDGTVLSYVAIQPEGESWSAHANLRLLATDRSWDIPLTDSSRPDDGPEFSLDGDWVYFNTELFTTADGHAQIARVSIDGSDLERLTHDKQVDWFPHLSPNGTHAVYISFPAGTTGHPADKPVELRIVELPEWDAPTATIQLFGGQGTINVTSWSPDGTEFGYVAYPTD